MMRAKTVLIALLMMSVLENPSKADVESLPADQCRFVGIHKFDDFHTETKTDGDIVQLSSVINAPMAWNELVVSWNTVPFEGTMKIEARAIYPDHQTGFYTLGIWAASEERHSERGQKDADGRVSTDTLAMQRPGASVQLRLTWKNTQPSLKFLGLSFSDSRARTGTIPENRTAWGKIVETPERSQHVVPGEEGWCSPASVSMTLARWSEALHRPELDIDVPKVAKGVIDTNYGAGNWPFNTAFAGSFDGMRAYVTRFSDISELEEWIAAGIPVIISAPWNLLHPGRNDTGSGHLVVCIGFAENGDVVINDPATNLNAGQHVRHVYARQNVIDAWRKSRKTVYLIYPETAKIPTDKFGHWDTQ